MRESDIRVILRETLEAIHRNEPDTLIRSELGLCVGETRVDLAAVNGEISGYEIKSASDTLTRFPRQVELYGRVLDRATAVVAPRFADAVAEHVPAWWGIWVADGGELDVVRHGARNPSPDPFSVAQLLWRDEALELLATKGQDKGRRKADRWTLWDVLAEWPFDELATAVRERLKHRQSWPGGEA